MYRECPTTTLLILCSVLFKFKDQQKKPSGQSPNIWPEDWDHGITVRQGIPPPFLSVKFRLYT